MSFTGPVFFLWCIVFKRFTKTNLGKKRWRRKNKSRCHPLLCRNYGSTWGTCVFFRYKPVVETQHNFILHVSINLQWVMKLTYHWMKFLSSRTFSMCLHFHSVSILPTVWEMASVLFCMLNIVRLVDSSSTSFENCPSFLFLPVVHRRIANTTWINWLF